MTNELIQRLDIQFLENPNCASTDPEVFFPERGYSTKPAIKICNSCIDKQPCLEFALTINEGFGVYGGMSERDRAALRRDHKTKVFGDFASGKSKQQIAEEIGFSIKYVNKLLRERSPGEH